MKIVIIAIGKIKQSPEQQLINEFLKKIPFKVEIKELEVKKMLEPKQLMKLEAKAIIEEIPKNSQIVILDPIGNEYSSSNFAKFIFSHAHITFIIGGAFGLDETIQNCANYMISLGKMTWPHKLARVMLIEQLYRAYTIHNNHPYNK